MKLTSTVTATMASVAPTYRHRIKRLYRSRVEPGPLNDEKRKALAQAIFEVANDLEHRNHDHPQVRVLFGVMNVLLDDCGENEVGQHNTNRWPDVEAAAGKIATYERKVNPPSVARFSDYVARKAAARSGVSDDAA
jgi:hypothetical protein